MSTATQVRIISVAPGAKRRTFVLQLSRPLTTGEAAELNLRAENPDFSGLRDSTLSVSEEDSSILVTGEMSADQLEAQLPDFEKFIALVVQEGRQLDEYEAKKAEQSKAEEAERLREKETEGDKVALARINQMLQNR